MFNKLLSVLAISIISISSTSFSAIEHDQDIQALQAIINEAPSKKDYPTYRIIDLGLFGTDSSEAIAINENGQVLGTYHEGTYSEIFLWEIDNGLKIIPPPQGNYSSFNPLKLNDNGQILFSARSSDGDYKIFIWDPHCGYWEVASSKNVSALSLNNKGQILLHIENKSILFDRGTKIDLRDLFVKQVPGTWESVRGSLLNNHGHIVFVARKRDPQKNTATDTSFLWKNGYFSEIIPEQPIVGALHVSDLDDDGNMICHVVSDNFPSYSVYIDHLNCIPIPCPYECSIIKNGFPMNVSALPGEMRKDKGGNLYISKGIRISSLIHKEFPFYSEFVIRDQNFKGCVVGRGKTAYDTWHAFLAFPND